MGSSPPSWPSGARSSSWSLSTTGSLGQVLSPLYTYQHIWPDDVSAVNVAAVPKGDVTASQRMNTSVAVAEVRWGRKRRWRWPRSICPPSTDTRGDQPVSISISQFSISSLKSLDRRSLSLEVFFSELHERLGSSEGQAGGAEVQIAAIGGERRFQKNSKLLLHSIFFHKHGPRNFGLSDPSASGLGYGSPLPPHPGEHKNKMKAKPGRVLWKNIRFIPPS